MQRGRVGLFRIPSHSVLTQSVVYCNESDEVGRSTFANTFIEIYTQSSFAMIIEKNIYSHKTL